MTLESLISGVDSTVAGKSSGSLMNAGEEKQPGAIIVIRVILGYMPESVIDSSQLWYRISIGTGLRGTTERK